MCNSLKSWFNPTVPNLTFSSLNCQALHGIFAVNMRTTVVVLMEVTGARLSTPVWFFVL